MKVPCHDLITSQRAHLHIPSPWGPGFQHMNFEVTQNIQSIASSQKTFKKFAQWSQTLKLNTV